MPDHGQRDNLAIDGATSADCTTSNQSRRGQSRAGNRHQGVGLPTDQNPWSSTQSRSSVLSYHADLLSFVKWRSAADVHSQNLLCQKNTK